MKIQLYHDFKGGGPKNGQHGVVKLGYTLVPTRREKRQSQHVPLN